MYIGLNSTGPIVTNSYVYPRSIAPVTLHSRVAMATFKGTCTFVVCGNKSFKWLAL